MKEDGLGGIFLRHLVMAITWGIILLVVMLIAAVCVKQEIKEGIQYGVRCAVSETANFTFDPEVVVSVKQNLKEGIEFVAKTGRDGIKDLLNAPQIKQDLKEALEYSGEKLRK